MLTHKGYGVPAFHTYRAIFCANVVINVRDNAVNESFMGDHSSAILRDVVTSLNIAQDDRRSRRGDVLIVETACVPLIYFVPELVALRGDSVCNIGEDGV